MADPLDLDALEKLLAAATPGEWLVDGMPHCHGTGVSAVNSGDTVTICRHVAASRRGASDAALIVALRNKAPALLAEVRALRKVATVAMEYRSNAKRGHSVACGYWKKEGICSCVVADSGDALDAALKEAGL